jgi:hypothetical protein
MKANRSLKSNSSLKSPPSPQFYLSANFPAIGSVAMSELYASDGPLRALAYIETSQTALSSPTQEDSVRVWASRRDHRNLIAAETLSPLFALAGS